MVEHQAPIIAFVWRPEEIIPPVTQMAHRTGSRAIFDVSTLGVEALRPFLRKADPAGQVRDIKISASTLMDPSLGPWLQETGVQDIWVECHPQFFPGDPAAVLERLRELSENHRCFPIIGDLNFLAAVLQDSSGIGRLVLKGCEASGFVSAETTLALYAAVKEMRPTASNSLDILIWGGVATPEAAAAFLATGAAGIVFESLHWLTDLVAIDDRQRQRLSRLRLDSTDLVGLDLEVPCRLFNKGNSLAFKEIKAFENSQCGAEITEASRRAFVSRVQARALHPLASHFSPDEVIPLGVEATFAASFVERFGAGTEGAVQAFMDEIRHACGLAEMKKDAWLDSPVAKEMGTLYPFIQGAMSWITEVPEFAAMVADAGGLPTIALGLMDAAALDRRLGGLPEIMGGRPYAVNVVSLAENPCRQAHLAWIKQHRPRFVVIAGGNLSFARELLECGLEVMYIAPDEALMRLALEAGVRYVICEGYEAGGHVGPHSTLTLAQMVAESETAPPISVPKLSPDPGRRHLQSGDRLYRRGARGGRHPDGHRLSGHPGDCGNPRLDGALSADDPGIAPGGNRRLRPGNRAAGAILEDPENRGDLIPGAGVCRGPPGRGRLSDENGGDGRGEPVRRGPGSGPARRGASFGAGLP